MSTPSPWQYFTIEELICHGTTCCDHSLNMDEEFMVLLVALCRATGVAMNLSSAYRCPEHNMGVSKTGLSGPHTTGRAVDILLNSVNLMKVLQMAPMFGMTGIGLKQHGSYKDRVIHLDNLPKANRQPRPHLWTYP